MGSDSATREGTAGVFDSMAFTLPEASEAAMTAPAEWRINDSVFSVGFILLLVQAFLFFREVRTMATSRPQSSSAIP